MTSHDVTHREEHTKEHHYDEKSAEQLAIAQHQLEFAFVIPGHKWIFYRYWLAGPPPSLSSARLKEVSMSSGSGNTIVVFFSAPISTRVCR